MTENLPRLSAALADHYRIERELGQGGMATVYLAEDLKHRRKVALKVLRPELAAELGPGRFLREVTIAANLQHPHILPLYDSGEADGFLYYVMPYIEGESLRERLQSQGEQPLPETVRILRDVLDALAAAHADGVVHRDIKPENIMLSQRHALVADFGVAKAVTEATGPHTLPTAGIALGTPTYMAPEQATADPHIDHRADLYAFGVTAYEMLTGRPPFVGPSPQAVLTAHVTEAPVAVTQRRPSTPPALAALIMRCLAKHPADRFQSAEEMLPVLEALATPSGGTTPFTTAPYRAAPSRRLISGPGALVVVALLAWGGWQVLRPKPRTIEFANIRQVTREPEPEISVAISPDGREVAYQSGYPGATHIVVRDVSGGSPLSLTGTWKGSQVTPGWMRDGRNVFFRNRFATADHAAGWWRLSRFGGQATIQDSVDWLAVRGGMIMVSEANLAASGSAQSPSIVVRPAAAHSLAPRTDGGAMAYVIGNVEYLGTWGNAAPSEIWVALVGKPPVRVTDTTSLNVSPAWLPDGTLLFVSNRDGARDIYAVRLDRSGAPRETPTRITTGLEPYSVSVSADGRTVAYDRFIVRRNIYAIPIPRTGSVSLREAHPVTTGNQTVESLDISDDGKWLAFDTNLQGNHDIYVMPAAGGAPRQVTRDPGGDFSPSFSPDGHEIAFHSTRDPTREIYVINTDGSGEQRLTSGPGEFYRPAFAPDGLRIAYSTGPPSGLYLLHRATQDAPWQNPERIAVDGAYSPRWSPDGTRLVYDLRNGRSGLGILPLGGTPQVLLEGGAAGLTTPRWARWSADGERVYFRGTAQDGVEGIYEIPPEGGTPRLLVRFDQPSMPVFGGAVTAGNGMFYLVVAEIESDIYVMDLVTE